MNIKVTECKDKDCFIPGKDWGHLSHMLCKHLSESKDGKESVCNKPESLRTQDGYY